MASVARKTGRTRPAPYGAEPRLLWIVRDVFVTMPGTTKTPEAPVRLS
jgi:hypothetical protein